MFNRKISFLLVLSFCFLLGMATKAEVGSVGKGNGEGVVDFDLTGEWTQKEIEYFQKKEYVGDKERYTPYSIDFFPPYLKGKIKEELEKYGIIGENGLKEIIREGKVSKLELLRYYNLLRDEIYARKGFVFRNSYLKEFFGMVNWYKPTSKEIALTGREERNLKVIEELEEIVKNTKVVSGLFSKQVIIKAKWGEGPGEFALEPLPESYEYRTSFTIDADGNVYIVDPNNQRINVFSKEGIFAKSIPIPEQLIYTYKDEKTSLVEGIGIDKNGSVYLPSSSTSALLTSGGSGEVVFKIDAKGKVLDSLTFKGYYVSPAIFYESDNAMYLWGDWEGGIVAGMPLEFGGKERVIQINFKQLRDNSFDRYKKSLNLGSRKIKINYDGTPVVFSESRNSKVVFYDGRNFVFQDSDGEIKTKINNRSLRPPKTLWFTYKEYKGVSVSAWPYIDSNLNIYCLDGTSTHLQVVKYTPTEEIWK